jgi:hypothetical protein
MSVRNRAGRGGIGVRVACAACSRVACAVPSASGARGGAMQARLGRADATRPQGAAVGGVAMLVARGGSERAVVIPNVFLRNGPCRPW